MNLCGCVGVLAILQSNVPSITSDTQTHSSDSTSYVSEPHDRRHQSASETSQHSRSSLVDSGCIKSPSVEMPSLDVVDEFDSLLRQLRCLENTDFTTTRSPCVEGQQTVPYFPPVTSALRRECGMYNCRQSVCVEYGDDEAWPSPQFIQMSSVHGETSLLQEGSSSLHGRMSSLQEGTSSLQRRMSSLHGGSSLLHSRLSSLQGGTSLLQEGSSLLQHAFSSPQFLPRPSLHGTEPSSSLSDSNSASVTNLLTFDTLNESLMNQFCAQSCPDVSGAASAAHLHVSSTDELHRTSPNDVCFDGMTTCILFKGELNLDNKWKSDDLFYIIMNEILPRFNQFCVILKLS